MKKKNRILIKLVSGSGSKHFYTTTKNKNKKKLVLKKFDPKKNFRFLYKETKI